MKQVFHFSYQGCSFKFDRDIQKKLTDFTLFVEKLDKLQKEGKRGGGNYKVMDVPSQVYDSAIQITKKKKQIIGNWR